MTIRRTIWLGVVLLAAGAAIYGGIYLSRPVVAVSSATVGPAVQAVYATGVVEPVTWAKVAPLVRGRIVELCACEGDEVARDHVLARLDDTEARAELAELEAREAFLASEVQRYRNLLEHSVVSTQVYERTNSELQQIRSAIRASASTTCNCARLGSSLQVTSPTGQSRLMKVVGIFRTGVTAIDDGEAYTLLKTAQILQERPNVVNEIRIRLADAFTARAVARRVEAMVGYKSESWQEANEDVLEIFFVRNIIMFTIVAGILVVAGFGIFNIISTITFEKARDIAILKSLGFEERDIRAIFLSEGLAIGVIGALLGWVLGYVLTRIVGSIPLEVDFYTEITQIPVLISPAHYALAAAFALVSSGLAGYLPARKAARQNPVDIIRGAA